MRQRRVLWAMLLSLLALPPAWAVTRYVEKTATCAGCSDSNSCFQSQTASTGKATVNAGIACTAAGDTLEVGNGSYNEYVRTGPGACPADGGDGPQGTPYTCNLLPSGTGSGARTVLKAKTGHTPKLRPTSGAPGGTVAIILIAPTATPSAWIDINGLELDGALCAPAASYGCGGVTIGAGANNIRLQSLNIHHTHQSGGGGGVFIYSNPNGVPAHTIEITDSTIHDNGFDSKHHGIYAQTRNILVARNTIYRNAGANVHFYRSNSPAGALHDNIIHSNLLYQDAITSTGAPTGTATANLIFGGDDNLVYNNLLRNSAGRAIRQAFDTPANNRIYNNSICSAVGAWLFVQSGSTGTLVTNNIAYQTAAKDDQTTGTTTYTTNIEPPVNPLYVTACGNLHLFTGSPAINTGTSLAGVFTTDYAGTTRSGTWERGAYDFGTVTPIHLEFDVPPSNTVEDVTMTPAVKVCAYDTTGIRQTSFAGNIALTLTTGTGGLAGGSGGAPTAGCREFPALNVDTVGTGKRITAAAAGATSIVSEPFDITAVVAPTAAMNLRRVR